MSDAQVQDVLEFWLGPHWRAGDASPEITQQWFTKDPAFDRELEARFGPLVEAAALGELGAWRESPEGRLALIILLDQFTRNIHRDSGAMYQHDPLASLLTDEALDAGDLDALPFPASAFLLMPLMHAEDLEAQERCVTLFQQVAAPLSGDLRELADNMVYYAGLHRDIVARWGRFPHRNALLDRPSTPEEIAFLKEPNSSF